MAEPVKRFVNLVEGLRHLVDPDFPQPVHPPTTDPRPVGAGVDGGQAEVAALVLGVEPGFLAVGVDQPDVGRAVFQDHLVRDLHDEPVMQVRPHGHRIARPHHVRDIPADHHQRPAFLVGRAVHEHRVEFQVKPLLEVALDPGTFLATGVRDDPLPPQREFLGRVIDDPLPVDRAGLGQQRAGFRVGRDQRRGDDHRQRRADQENLFTQGHRSITLTAPATAEKHVICPATA